MKIQCDVCSKEEASVFCAADEAALCDGCDRRVHHANKLASKHPRFSLLPSSPSPLCDICQEKRAFLFCQQDRAILCKDCDVRIHTANELTLKHHRFLLTGVKLSSTPTLYSAVSGDLVPDYSAANNNIKSHQPLPPPPPANKNTTATSSGDHQTLVPDNNCSTISEYLMEMLPGWHVEDLLEAATTPYSTPFGFSRVDGGLLSFGETYGEADSNSSNNSEWERLGIWVPQAPPPAANFMYNKEAAGNRRWTTDELFAVPQISTPPSSVGSKRSRPF